MNWRTLLQIALLLLFLLALFNENVSALWMYLLLGAVLVFSILRLIAFARTGEVDTTSGYPRWFWKMALDEQDEAPAVSGAANPPRVDSRS